MDLSSTLSICQNPYIALALACQIFSRLFCISVKRRLSEKVWLPDCDPGRIEHNSNFKWIKSSLESALKVIVCCITRPSTESRGQ
jgi:hypothetical protein